MTEAQLLPTTVHVPRYITAHVGSGSTAHFKDAGPKTVERGRERAYPGLPSEAPRTASIYKAFASFLAEPKTVWDIGCGSGLGSAILQHAGHTVMGVDTDPDALEFARLFAPTVRFALPSELKGQPAANASVMVDVLGFCDSPRQTLWALHELAPGAQLLIAEPRASVAQKLSAPQKTAFSVNALRAVLTRAGYSIDDEFSCSTFAIIAATPSSPEVGRSFELAASHQAAARFEEGLEALKELRERAPSEIARAALLDSAELHACLGDGDAASAMYLRVLAQSARDPDALGALSQLTLASGNIEDAVTLAVQAMDSDSTHAGAACSLALSAERLSPLEGFKAWQMAASLAPAEPTTQSRLAAYASAVGHKALAIAALEQLRAHHPSQGVDFHVTLAWLLLGAGRAQDAKLEARIAGAVGPNEPGVAELWDALLQN